MAQYVETQVGPGIAGEALSRYLRVKFDGSGRLVKAGLADRDLGTCEMDAPVGDGDKTNLRYRGGVGTRKLVASKAIAKGADLYTAANGKVSDTAASTSYYYGTSFEAAGQDGDIFEALAASTAPSFHNAGRLTAVAGTINQETKRRNRDMATAPGTSTAVVRERLGGAAGRDRPRSESTRVHRASTVPDLASRRRRGSISVIKTEELIRYNTLVGRSPEGGYYRDTFKWEDANYTTQERGVEEVVDDRG
jgi:hypothetical protein